MHALSVFSTVANATSVVEVSVEEMLQNSALVFEGRVVDTKTRESGNNMIQTRVTFEVIDVIKGEVKGRMLTLGFLGGTLGNRQLSVSKMQLPDLDEYGIYFVESPGRLMVNPLYGWSQGHIKLQRDASGVERVLTADDMPVSAIERTGSKRSGRLSRGAARGLKLGVKGEPGSALDKNAFKRQLRSMQ